MTITGAPFTSIFALGWLLLPLIVRAQPIALENLRAFRFGFSIALMPEVNENDSRAAMKIWAETMFKTGSVKADPTVAMYRDYRTMFDAMRRDEVDGVAMTTAEYFQLRDHVKINHYVFGVVDGSISDEYLLLVHRDSGFQHIADLRNHSLNLQRHSRMCLATPWVETLLSTNGGVAAKAFFSHVLEMEKLTATVLPVFFRKTDACVVNRKGFKAMSDLNPQVGQRLRIIATSPALVPTGFFFLNSLPAAQQRECLAQFTKLHVEPTGHQILTVFQTERLEEYPVTALDSALNLLTAYEKLSRDSRPPDTSIVGVDPAKESGK